MEFVAGFVWGMLAMALIVYALVIFWTRNH